MIKSILFTGIIVSSFSTVSCSVEFDPSKPVYGNLIQDGVRVSKRSIVRGLAEKEECVYYLESRERTNKTGLPVLLISCLPLFTGMPSSNDKKTIVPLLSLHSLSFIGAFIGLEFFFKGDFYLHKALLAHNASLDTGAANAPYLPVIKEDGYYRQGGIDLGWALPYVLSERKECRRTVILHKASDYSAMFLLPAGGCLILGGFLVGAYTGDEDMFRLIEFSGLGCIGASIGFAITSRLSLKASITRYNNLAPVKR